MKNFFNRILGYLKDWKNILTHILIGLAILAVAVFVPVPPLYRVLFLVIVVAFNIIRMSLEKKGKMKEAVVPVPVETDPEHEKD